jgi:ATP-dependent RNA helicase TDRD9
MIFYRIDIEIDFLLIILRRLLMNRSSKTKIILMSATMEDRLEDFFKLPIEDDVSFYPAKIDLESLQRKHHIIEYYLDDVKNMLLKKSEMHTLKVANIDYPEIDPKMYKISAKLALLLMSSPSLFDIFDENPSYKGGNLLVFLPGLHEIECFYKELLDQLELIKSTKQYFSPEINILHSSLSTEEQKAAFVDNAKPKIILSTNIAESSVTLPKIAYVIDFCLTKYHRKLESSQISTLTLDWASKNNCQQRAGRAGRVCKGSVYRLVPKKFYLREMREFPIPEMTVAPLESVILKIKMLDMGKPLEILALALDPPDESSILNAVLTLKELGGLFLYNKNGFFEYDDGDITFMGEIMSSLPVDVRISKLIILGYLYSVLEEAIIIGAGLSVRGIFSHSLHDKIKVYEAKLEMAQGE